MVHILAYELEQLSEFNIQTVVAYIY